MIAFFVLKYFIPLDICSEESKYTMYIYTFSDIAYCHYCNCFILLFTEPSLLINVLNVSWKPHIQLNISETLQYRFTFHLSYKLNMGLTETGRQN